MQRVTGIGGIFIKSPNAENLLKWYTAHLGITQEFPGGTSFSWRHHEEPEKVGQTIWSVMNQASSYFDPSSAPFMVNYRVADLHALLKVLREEGVTVDEKVEESEYGKFGWVMDPDGNRIELWEPPADDTNSDTTSSQ